MTLLLPSTRRLELRWLAPQDEKMYCELYTDPRLMRLIAPVLDSVSAKAEFTRALRAQDAPPRFPESIAGVSDRRSKGDPFAGLPWHEASSPAQGLRAVAQSMEDGRVVAMYGLDRWDLHGLDWEMGVMAPRLAHGRGYAVEGMAALVEWLFAQGAARVLLRCRADNLAACRVARRMAFESKRTESPEGEVMLWARVAPWSGGQGDTPAMSFTTI